MPPDVSSMFLPDSELTAGAVRSQVDRILASPTFANATRLSRFLTFVVDSALAGETGQIKESVIGVEVFDRRPGAFNPGSDSVVRVQARRLRDKLAQYYAGDGAADSLIIELPSGRYLPSFSLRPSTRAQHAAQTADEPVDASRDNSVAVLPFVNVSADADNEYFSDGLTEELIHALGTVPLFRVSGRGSSFQFKGQHRDARDIGALLGVGKVVEGSVRKAKGRVRITVQLVSVSDGRQLWSERYDRASTDIFAVQEEIANSICLAVLGESSGQQPRWSTLTHGTANRDAFDHYLKGRFHWNKRSERDFRLAIDHFKAAIEKDASYARAYAGLADCYVMLGMSGADAPAVCMPRAREAAERALQIEDRLVDAHTSLAAITANFDWERGRAKRRFLRALELDGTYPTLHQWYGLFGLAPERQFDEAGDQMRRAERLDPVSLPIALDLALVHILAGRYKEAMDQCVKVLDLDPGYHRAHWFLGLARERLGDFQGSVEALERALAVDLSLDSGSAFRPRIKGALGRCAARAGNVDRAHEVLGDMSSSEAYVDPFEIAQIHVGLGDIESAIGSLNRGIEVRSSYMIFVNAWPGFEALRVDPRFASILSELSLASPA